mmetsp:Transcript_57037/g.158847  ORF Transcript_57037/g.158847 Transcript_57037/m.158847 type:complete len:254 (+) Transcript_57037:73-834(+)
MPTDDRQHSAEPKSNPCRSRRRRIPRSQPRPAWWHGVYVSLWVHVSADSPRCKGLAEKMVCLLHQPLDQGSLGFEPFTGRLHRRLHVRLGCELHRPGTLLCVDCALLRRHRALPGICRDVVSLAKGDRHLAPRAVEPPGDRLLRVRFVPRTRWLCVPKLVLSLLQPRKRRALRVARNSQTLLGFTASPLRMAQPLRRRIRSRHDAAMGALHRSGLLVRGSNALLTVVLFNGHPLRCSRLCSFHGPTRAALHNA